MLLTSLVLEGRQMVDEIFPFQVGSKIQCFFNVPLRKLHPGRHRDTLAPTPARANIDSTGCGAGNILKITDGI